MPQAPFALDALAIPAAVSRPDEQQAQAHSAVAPSRHAQVVPAFVALTVRRSLQGWSGTVEPGELLCWQRKAELSESARRDLRDSIVKRSRVKAERLWAQPVGVRLAADWRERVPSADRRRIEQLALTKAKPLETWTLREVKEALRVPLEQVLGLLARLEALYWVATQSAQRKTSQRHVERHVEHYPPVPVTAELRALAASALELPWLGKVSCADLRFGHDGPGLLAVWIQAQLAQALAPGMLPGLLERLLSAHQLTAAEEARELVLAAARDCAPRQGGDETLQRWTSMLLRRYLSPRGSGRTLNEVGDEFGVTRERIRQICDAFEEIFAQTAAVTPALDRVLQAAARVAPCEVAELDLQLGRFIGEGAGVESLVGWATMLGHDTLPVRCERTRTYVRRKVVELTMVQLPDAASWVDAMIRHVSRDSSMFGCSNVLRVAGRLALKEGIAPGQESIETALEAAAGFRWLDRASGWFTLGDSSGCSAASRVRKIIAVAHDTIGTSQIAAAFAGDDMWMYRESGSLGLATPPVHVLRELFLGWTWLRLVQRGRFVAGPGFDASGALSELEQAAVEVISAHQGVACRFELKEAVVGRLGLTDVLLAAILGSSPIFERFEHGLYGLIGRRVGDGAMNAARRRLRERSGAQVTEPADKRSNEFFARVTEASLKNEQYHVPTRFKERLAGKRHKVVDADGRVLGEVWVNASGALSELNGLLEDAAAGAQYGIEVLETGLRLRSCERDSEPARTVDPGRLAPRQASASVAVDDVAGAPCA